MNQAMQQEFTPQQIRFNRLKLFALWMIPFGLMAIAGLVFVLEQRGVISLGSKNNGILIEPPIQVSEWALTYDNNTDLEDLFDGHWTIATLGNEHCDKDCQAKLHLTRQIHVRLDKEANRVQRIHFTESLPLDSSFSSLVESEYRYLKVAQLESAQLELLNGALGPDASQMHFFLIDPQGWAMMYYLPEHDGGLALKDLKHLLKYSRGQ